jgi:hypothetical protein
MRDYAAWKKKKKLIQDAMPYLEADLRELFLSKTCGSCFDKLFPPCEDE